MGCWQGARERLDGRQETRAVGLHPRWADVDGCHDIRGSAWNCEKNGVRARSAVEAFDSDARIWAFNLRLMRSGAALLVALEIVYFVLDIYISPP